MKWHVFHLTVLHLVSGYNILEESVDIDVREFQPNITFTFGGHVWHSITNR